MYILKNSVFLKSFIILHACYFKRLNSVVIFLSYARYLSTQNRISIRVHFTRKFSYVMHLRDNVLEELK